MAGSYKFNDPDNHKEGATEYKWYVSDSENGEYKEVASNQGNALELTEEFWNKYVKLEVTPVDEYQGKGKPVSSNPVGPVYLNVVSNPGFENKAESWKEVSIEESEETYQGEYSGSIKNGETGYQTITVPETGYYDLSVYAKTKNGKQWKFGVRDKAGKPIAEEEGKGKAEYFLHELKNIPLEKGSMDRYIFTVEMETRCGYGCSENSAGWLFRLFASMFIH